MPRVGPEIFQRLQNDPSCIRNICIVAHVDHGKTSLSDSLLASNGIISQRLAGKIRFLDSRPDEQLRGITMESSAISLYFRVLHKQDGKDEPLVNEHLVNLIDSPGHIDFSSEVSAASRLCDGAVVLVDVVEGVCSQTITVLRQCWIEKLKPILVLNKIDRLILELQLTPQEAYLHLSKVIEQVNSVIGSFYVGERQLDDLSWREQLESNSNAEFIEKDDSDIYFNPTDNNVIFASAFDGWGFNIGQLAKFYEQKLGAKRENLQKVLWGDFFMEPKTKKIINNKGLKGRNLKPLFVSLILDNIWKIYENVIKEKDLDTINKITSALNIKLSPYDFKTKDDKQLLKTIMGQWLPVSTAVLLTVIEKLPSPSKSQEQRLDTILGHDHNSAAMEPELVETMTTCDRNGPLCAYVSKILSIPRDELPINGNANNMVTPDQFEKNKQIREEALRAAKQAELSEKLENLNINKDNGNNNEEDLYARADGNTTKTPDIQVMSKEDALKSDTFEFELDPTTATDPLFEYEQEDDATTTNDKNGMLPDLIVDELDPNDPMNALFEYESTDPFQVDNNICGIDDLQFEYEEELEEDMDDLFDEKDEVLIGFARVYSGTLKVGEEISVLGPKYDPENPSEHIQTATITSLYLFMGKELVSLDECPAGNIVGIGGLAGKILKNGTLIQKDIKGINLAGVNFHTTPIVRVAVESVNPMEMNKLVRGLKLLNQADPCVDTYVNDNGEHILCTAGELHLERCLKDLHERFAGVEITHSEPAIPYMESFLFTDDMNPPKDSGLGRGVIEYMLGKYKIKLRTVPMSPQLIQFLNKNKTSLVNLFNQTKIELHENMEGNVLTEEQIKDKLTELLSADNHKESENNDDDDDEVTTNFKDLLPEDSINKIAAFGPKRVGCNMLMSENQLLNSIFNEKTSTFEYSDSIINGFQLSVNEGPLAKEPVEGMCIIIEDIHEMNETEINEIEDPHYQIEEPNLSGRFMTTIRDKIHELFLDWSPRIMWAMYTCDIQTSMEALGKVYAVVQQRQGKIISEEMKEGTPFFQIVAHIPVVEAFGFSEDLRKKTSGAAQPQLMFSGFECIDLDPFWVPTTEAELEELGDTADKENVARRHMNYIRRRKGLFIDEKVIQNAEKQRTLKRN